jgi:hypothetical protein
MSLMDFVVSPPGCCRSVTNFWGWDAHEAQLRCPDEVDGDTVEPLFTNLIRSWRPFVTWNVRKPKLFFPMGVLFNNIFKKPQNTMKFNRRHGEFEQGCVLSESYTATDTLPPILPACRQPLLPACVFVTWDTETFFGKFVREPICSWWEAFVNRYVRDERRSWTDLFVMRGVRELRLHCTWIWSTRSGLKPKFY